MCIGGGGQQRYETEQERDARVAGQARAQTAVTAETARADNDDADALSRQQAINSSRVNPIFNDVKLGQGGTQ